ncbi:beta-galactosidase, partial [Paenibacillus sepulcri]|nr:beta-galactosidase [Paenibacillus sepulcri]
MGKSDWLRKRNLSVFMTPRDIDVPGLDAERLARDLHDMNVTMISFLVGGYIANYPTELPMQRKVPGLGQRDLPKDVIEAVHRYGIKAIAAIDLGVLPAHAAEAHPDWCATDINGKPYVIVPGELYNACLMGGYYTDYGFRMVREILGRYDADGIQLNNFGFTGKGICYCPGCRSDFRRVCGEEIPERKDWSDPVFRRFMRWREMKTNEGAQRMRRMVKKVDPELPFMGNSACFGDADWVLGSSIDKEGVAEFEDIVKVEAQTRIKSNIEQDNPDWQWIHWTAEEASFLTSVI